MAQSDGITPAILLGHMQAMEQRLLETMDKKFVQVDARFNQIDTRLDRLESKVDHNHIQAMGQLDMIDKRLDDIECVQVPSLKKAVGMR